MTRGSSATLAVFFDVDFTLIEPGPMFRAEGYEAFCAKYGITVNSRRFARAVKSASRVLDQVGTEYDDEVFVAYTARIIENMGGEGDRVAECAREICDEWAACRHFNLYEEAGEVLRDLVAAGLQIGLISNSQRNLAEFESHFKLQGIISAAVSSSAHGKMKPHPEIFEAGLALLGVRAEDAVMVGDNIAHDIEGALGAGMRAVLVHRSETPHPQEIDLARRGVPVIRSLRELPAALG